MADKTSYLGNQNLKRSGVALGWDAEKIQEYKKCSTDPIYFIKTYIINLKCINSIINSFII